MSPNRKSGGFSPTRLTFDEFQQFAKLFKQLIEGSHLKWWIILAGTGGLAEALHIVWLALRWIFRF